MKVVKYILLFILLSVIGLFILGLVNSKVTTEVSIEVEAPTEKAFNVAMNPDLLNDWLSSEKMKFVKIDPRNGAPQAGEQFKIYYDWGEKDIVLDGIVRKFEINEEYSFSLEDKHTAFDVSMYFKDNGKGGSIIKETSTGGAKSPFFRGLMSLSKGSMQIEKDKQYERLKELIESQP